MKKFLKNSKTPILICGCACLLAIAAFILIFFLYSQGVSNLAKQQQWASGKDNFDAAYEIAVADKDTPDKTLYIPKLVDQFGKPLNEAIADIGQGAKILKQEVVGKPNDKVEVNTSLVLTNESGNTKSGTPTVVFGTNHAGKVTKASFSGSTWLLGYGALSFVDMINNEHICEKSLREAGLNVEDGRVSAPTNSSLYTTYTADGTTVQSESCDFNGTEWQNKHKYSWAANLSYNYSIANAKGDLADTVRVLTISIES